MSRKIWSKLLPGGWCHRRYMMEWHPRDSLLIRSWVSLNQELTPLFPVHKLKEKDETHHILASSSCVMHRAPSCRKVNPIESITYGGCDTVYSKNRIDKKVYTQGKLTFFHVGNIFDSVMMTCTILPFKRRTNVKTIDKSYHSCNNITLIQHSPYPISYNSKILYINLHRYFHRINFKTRLPPTCYTSVRRT